MFGVVRPYVPELRVREHEYYKGVYCGLCRSMKKHTTEISCASLSFDMTFFALLRLWLEGKSGDVKMRRCGAHPFKKRPMMCDTTALEHTSYVSAYLTYFKLSDDVKDERGLKRLFARIARAFSKIPLSKIPKEYAPLGETIRDHLDALSALEKQKCKNPSEVADEFGKLLGSALAFGLDGEKAVVAESIGLHVGRWVYLADAACDIEDDEKSGSYNPFLCAMTVDDAKKFVADGLDGVLSMELVDAIKAYDVGPGRLADCSDCILNTLNMGMRNSLSEALCKNKQEKKHERSL